MFGLEKYLVTRIGFCELALCFSVISSYCFICYQGVSSAPTDKKMSLGIKFYTIPEQFTPLGAISLCSPLQLDVTDESSPSYTKKFFSQLVI
jgi:hypothetical protein